MHGRRPYTLLLIMKNRTKIITLSAMLAALQLALLYIGTLLPTWKLAMAALAGVITAAGLIECGAVSSILVYIAVSALGIIILPQKSVALFYAVFFGYYPLIKSLAEHTKNRVAEWIVKLAVFNFACAMCYLGLRLGLLDDVKLPRMAIYIIWAALNAVFVIFDLGLSKLIFLYIERIHKKIK